jgi:hypothetical protein
MEQVGIIELGQQLDDILLTRRIVRVSIETFLPYLLHRTVRTQANDKIMGLGAQAKVLVVKGIPQDVPGLAAETLFVHPDRMMKTHLEAGNPVP